MTWNDEPDPAKVDVCRRFLKVWPAAEFGPAHIVLADHNFEDVHISWCQGLLYGVQEERKKGGSVLYPEHSDAELESTRLVLIEIRSGLPETRLVVAPDARLGATLTAKVTRWEDISQ